MSEYQMFSPQSPNPAENDGVRPLILERERKMQYLDEQEIQYQDSMKNYELALHRHQLAEHKKNSTRSSKRRRACQGCTSKWCEDCNLETAAKKMRTAADNISETIAELADIEERIKNGPTITRNRIGPESTDNNNDVKEEVKQENADVKQENDDGTYATTIGIVNAVKSEPSDDYPTSSEDSNTNDSADSDDASADDSYTNDSDSDDASADDTDRYTNDDNDSVEDSASIQAEYPSTPSQTDTDEDTDDETEDETEEDTEEDNDDRITVFQKILNRL